jgi:hypothetical protein
MLQMHAAGVQDVKMVAWHPGGELLASASYDDSIKLWRDAGDEWECIQTLSGDPTACTTFSCWSDFDEPDDLNPAAKVVPNAPRVWSPCMSSGMYCWQDRARLQCRAWLGALLDSVGNRLQPVGVKHGLLQ